jgi:hypothetical protein
MASQSHRICVADSASCRQLSQVGSFVNPSLKRCPFRWQCLVSSPTTHLSWSLFSFNRSFRSSGRGSWYKSLCLFESSCGFPVFFMISIQSLTAFLATPVEMPQAGSGPVNECSDPVIASWAAVSLPTVPAWLGGIERNSRLSLCIIH